MWNWKLLDKFCLSLLFLLAPSQGKPINEHHFFQVMNTHNLRPLIQTMIFKGYFLVTSSKSNFTNMG